MPSGGTALRLGPFTGGLNNSSDPSAIKDTELSVCDNFDIDSDGALTSRPPITAFTSGPVAGQNLDILGYFIDSAGNNWLLASTNNAVYYHNSGAWVTITTGFRCRTFVQYLNKAWLVAEPGSASNGGSWEPTTLGAAGTFTTVASMPKGTASGTYKERMFIAAGGLATSNESRLSFSNLANPAVWSGSDFIDVNPGDGQKLLDLFVVGSNMYLFKTDSTYVYSYDSSPSKGVINNLSKTVGVSDTRCVVQYENYLLVLHEEFVYELINGVFQRLNYKVDFVPDFVGGTSYFRPTSLSIVGDRLIVRFYDKTFVFSFKTRTWSTWTSTFIPSNWVVEPKPNTVVLLRKYYAGASQINSSVSYSIQDGFDASASESFVCTATTRVFDFDEPGQFKKMYWWGVDVLSSGIVTGTVIPVIYTFNITWASLLTKLWSEMTDFTWGQPGDIVPVVEDTADTAGSRGRKFIKFLKSLRVRNVMFSVELETTGTSDTAPVKLFTINPVVDLRQRVPKKVN